MKFHSLLLFIFTAINLTACGNSPDLTQPDEVVRDFTQAILAEDFDKAQSHMLAENNPPGAAEEAYKELKELPPIPDRLEIRCFIDKHEAQCNLTNWFSGANLDLVFEENRWWIR